MRIGAAAAAAGTTPRVLRCYEQRGLLPPPARTATGQRQNGPRDVARVRLIRELLSAGPAVEDVRARAEDPVGVLDGDTLPPCDSPECAYTRTAEIVGRRLRALDAEITRLTRLRERLADGAGALGARSAGSVLDAGVGVRPGGEGSARA